MDADEIARIRSIPLSTVLEVLGAKRDPNDSVPQLASGFEPHHGDRFALLRS